MASGAAMWVLFLPTQLLVGSVLAVATAQVTTQAGGERPGNVVLPTTATSTHEGAVGGSVVSVVLHKHRRILDRGVRNWGSLVTRDLYSSEYYGLLTIGTPAQEFRVVFDTGSGNIVLPSASCTAPACLNHRRYDANASSTSVPIMSSQEEPGVRKTSAAGRPPETLTLTYGTGEVVGIFARDRVCVGTLCTRVTVVTATNESDDPFKDVPFDGILGLGLPQLVEGDGFSLIDALVKGGHLQRNVFSVFIGAGQDEKSEITFGAIREERMQTPISWVPVANPAYWQAEMEDIMLGTERLHLCSYLPCQAGLDTGTAMIAGPARLVRQLVGRLRLAGDCHNVEMLPTMVFLLGDQRLQLEPADYVDTADGSCALRIMPLDIPPPRGPLFILGIPLLRKYYTVYDRERLRVGFALARHSAVTGGGDRAERADELRV